MRNPSVSGNADDVSAGLRSEVSAPDAQDDVGGSTQRVVCVGGADLFLAAVLFTAAGRRVGLGSMS